MKGKTSDRIRKKHWLALTVTAVVTAALLPLTPPAALTARADYREFEYDLDTPWTNDDVQEMLDYACYWVGKIPYKSSVTDNDPDGERFMELAEGRGSDCSWFVYHVLYRFGLVGEDFIHSYEWGNEPGCYPGAYNIGSDISDAVPGDIICTGTGTKSNNSHVAMYIGDGMVVECCAGEGVIISDAPWDPREIVHFACIPTHEVSKTVDTE
ncbi:MAG: C40 family peptidase [Lachnospiraceae bacterium]|nr:C40 family peptidase [Lachnospiraceae bacterium]